MNKSLVLNFILFPYMGSIALLMGQGKLTIGWGLGDVFPYITIICLIIIQVLLGMYGALLRKVNLINWIWIILFLFSLYTTYSVTFGRGLEHQWNGSVFIN